MFVECRHWNDLPLDLRVICSTFRLRFALQRWIQYAGLEDVFVSVVLQLSSVVVASSVRFFIHLGMQVSQYRAQLGNGIRLPMNIAESGRLCLVASRAGKKTFESGNRKKCQNESK